MMRVLHPSLLLAAILLWTGTATAAEKVALRFTEPKTYADGTLRDYNSGKAREETYIALHKVFEKLAGRYLAEGQTMAVELTDLDLAGRFEPWRVNLHDVRFMRNVTWPRMAFSYAVYQDGSVVTSGSAEVQDMNYLHGINRNIGNERLYYERRMLSDWFSKTFERSQTADAGLE